MSFNLKESKIGYLFMLLIFLPAFGQVVQKDTSKIKIAQESFDSSLIKMTEALDSLKAYNASTTKDNPDFKRKYNVDKPDGERVTWVFNYKIEDNKWTDTTDTIFIGVNKSYSYWKK